MRHRDPNKQVVNYYIRCKLHGANIGIKERLPALTLPGLYTMMYLTPDETLCADCAAERLDAYFKEQRRRRAGRPKSPVDPIPTAMTSYDEGSTIECDACGHLLKASYGDPEATDEENDAEADRVCQCYHCQEWRSNHAN